MQNALLARQLDEQTLALRRATDDLGDPEWIPMLRKAFGLSLRKLGKRVGVSGDAIHKLEKSARKGTITVKSLRKVAQTMGCRVVVAILPARGASFAEIASEFDPQVRVLLMTNTAQSHAALWQLRKARYGVEDSIYRNYVPRVSTGDESAV